MLNIISLLIPQRFVGIDIGTADIKVVEIAKIGNRRKLENYGSISAEVLYKQPFRTFDKNTLLLSSHDVARAIKAVLQEAKIRTKQAVFSIPDFSTFFTNFELPQMSKEEIPQAVKFEAKQHIPFPLSEMTLDWRIMDSPELIAQNKKMNILLAAVPNEVINQYSEIAKLAGLELYGMEAEVFGLIRSLISSGNRDSHVIVDIGAQSTTCSVVDGTVLYSSHSFDLGGNEITNLIAKSLGVGHEKAEEIKRTQGMLEPETFGAEKNLKEVLSPMLDTIVREIDGIIHDFHSKKRKVVKKIILAGGMSLLPGLKEYIAQSVDMEVEIANPFSSLFYPPVLEATLKKMGPAYAIAVGSALRGMGF